MMSTDEVAADEQLPVLLSGGLQQYLIRQSVNQQPQRGAGSESMTFHDLPDSVQLHIFSYLGPADLSRISRVCRHWYSVSCDDSLWKSRLKWDIKTWNTIGHTTNPDADINSQSDMHFKEIYLRCSPHVNRLLRQQNVGFQRLSDLLRSFWPKKPPKLAMFGPGLESSTSGIVRKIIEGKSGLFSVVKMFPGQFGGVGSGFTLKSGDETLDLITLYTAPQSEREQRNAEQRANNSRLLSSASRGNAAVDDYELQPAVKDLCRTLDGLIYVVDATATANDIAVGRAELFAMLNNEWTPAVNPIVVLACSRDSNVPRRGCIDVVRTLQLSNLNRPWQAHDCVVDTMEGVEAAFHWVIKTCYRK